MSELVFAARNARAFAPLGLPLFNLWTEWYAGMTAPVRLPDAASLETVLVGLDATSTDADLLPALSIASGFEFDMARIDNDYRRVPDR